MNVDFVRYDKQGRIMTFYEFWKLLCLEAFPSSIKKNIKKCTF